MVEEGRQRHEYEYGEKRGAKERNGEGREEGNVRFGLVVVIEVVVGLTLFLLAAMDCVVVMNE